MPYAVYLHDSWGNAHVGSFQTLEQAREVFEALCNDRWCLDDGTILGVSIVEVGVEDGVEGAGSGRIVARHSFQRS